MVSRCARDRHHGWDVDAGSHHRSHRPAYPGARCRMRQPWPGGRTERPMTRPAPARWCLVVVFAAGMAWVEAASVYYLRAMVDRIEPYQMNPLPMHGVL